jgi:hypothetical protein
MKSFDDKSVMAILHHYYQSSNIDNNFIYSKYDNLNLLVDYIEDYENRNFPI